jgi:hypothetical protein
MNLFLFLSFTYFAQVLSRALKQAASEMGKPDKHGGESLPYASRLLQCAKVMDDFAASKQSSLRTFGIGHAEQPKDPHLCGKIFFQILSLSADGEG